MQSQTLEKNPSWSVAKSELLITNTVPRYLVVTTIFTISEYYKYMHMLNVYKISVKNI